MRAIRILGVLCLWAIAFAVSVRDVSEQITTGNVIGTVKDAQGAVVPGATVTLIDEAKSLRIGPVTTNEEGTYVFPNVTAATYTVEVAMDGFKTTQRKGIPVSGGDRVSVPAISLELGGKTETVTVTAEAALVQAQSVNDLSRSRLRRSRTCRSFTATSRASSNWRLV